MYVGICSFPAVPLPFRRGDLDRGSPFNPSFPSEGKPGSKGKGVRFRGSIRGFSSIPCGSPIPEPGLMGNEPGSKGRFQPVSSRNEPGRILGGRLGSSGARGWTTSRTSNATTVAPRCGWHVHLDPSSLISGRRVRFAGPAASGRRRAPWFERWETPPRTRTAACSWDRRIWPGTPSRRSIS